MLSFVCSLGSFVHALFNLDHCSTKGVGRTIPDPKEFKTLEDGVVVPVGSPIDTSNIKVSYEGVFFFWCRTFS